MKDKKEYMYEKLYNAEHLTKSREIKKLKKEIQRLKYRIESLERALTLYGDGGI
jgi:predicted  nucleic acid-binding Zn-ribbon protein